MNPPSLTPRFMRWKPTSVPGSTLNDNPRPFRGDERPPKRSSLRSDDLSNESQRMTLARPRTVPFAPGHGRSGRHRDALCRALAALGYRVLVADLDLTPRGRLATPSTGNRGGVDVGDCEANLAMVIMPSTVRPARPRRAQRRRQLRSSPARIRWTRAVPATNRVNLWTAVVSGIDASRAWPTGAARIVVHPSLAALVPSVQPVFLRAGQAAVVVLRPGRLPRTCPPPARSPSTRCARVRGHLHAERQHPGGADQQVFSRCCPRRVVGRGTA